MQLVADAARMDLRDALDFAVLVEEDAQLRYEELSHLLGADPGGAGAVFRAMAVNEAKHGRAIAERRAELFRDAAPRLEISALEGPERPELGEGDLPATAREALEVALAAERRAHAFYASALRGTLEPGVRAFFGDLVRDEAEHAALLEAELAALGAPATPAAPTVQRRACTAPAPAAYPDRTLLAAILPRFDAATRMVAESIVVEGLPEEVVADSLGVSRRTVARKLARFLEVAREHLAVALTAAALTGCGGGLGLAESPSSAHGAAVDAQRVAAERASDVTPGGSPAGVQRETADPAGDAAGEALARPRAAEEAARRTEEADTGRESEAEASPVIGELSPGEAPASGGAAVVIRGENLDAAQVTVDGIPARILDAAGHLVVIELPEAGPGQAVVRVTNRDGRFALKGFRLTR
ncbi:MAG TPA: ferritin family protein [Anaeromyxobacteraceae bacterium]|nr:ferritin family protein [Anaeromyxobacteraceae bacterium]